MVASAAQPTWAYETDGVDGSVIDPPTAEKKHHEIEWRNVVIFTLMLLGAIYGGYLFFFKAKWATIIFAYILYICSALGVTAGAHRLWSHNAYKAKLPLRIILAIFNAMAFQYSVFHWARYHRSHHKYSDTDADPHNASRGFFFSHVGWLLVNKHPDFKAKGRKIDMSDLLADPVLKFQKKYYLIIMTLFCFILPTYIPTLWGESLWNSFFVCALFRYVYLLNVTWLVNSAAHMFGSKPYDKNIKPVENRVISVLALGEGFHNFHHIFPWDSRAAELGGYAFNFTNLFLDAMGAIGWAYDFKTVSREVVVQRAKRTGDGSHHVWGWNDKDVPKLHRNFTKIG